MTSGVRRVLGLALSVLCSVASARAQQVAPRDSLYRRVQHLATSGDGAAAHALLDSLVSASAEGSDARAEALFWRANFAADSQSAQADYLTIIIDHALSPRAADALLRLGRSELERGDRETALRHFERLVLEHASATAASDGWYWLGRARILDNDLAGACVALDSALSRLPEADIERRRPVLYYSQPCKNLVVAPVAPIVRDTGTAARPKRDTIVAAVRGDTAPVTARRDAAPPGRRDSAPAKSPVKPKYSVQIAAYDSRAGAETLVKKLNARGYDARVDSLKLFHVRIGEFTARADAVALVNKLKQQGQTAIVVEVERRDP